MFVPSGSSNLGMTFLTSLLDMLLKYFFMNSSHLSFSVLHKASLMHFWDLCVQIQLMILGQNYCLCGQIDCFWSKLTMNYINEFLIEIPEVFCKKNWIGSGGRPCPTPWGLGSFIGGS